MSLFCLPSLVNIAVNCFEKPDVEKLDTINVVKELLKEFQYSVNNRLDHT